jgi:hypothetical protein
MHMGVFGKLTGLALFLALGSVVCAFAQPSPSQSAQNTTQDYQQRVTKALDAAKKNADALNDQYKSLLDAVKRASDPQQAQKALDDLTASADKALKGFNEKGEMMQAVDGLLAFIEDRQKNAENEAKTDPRWQARVTAWQAHAANIRQLREDLLQQVDRSRIFLDKLAKEKKLITDMIAGEGVASAKAELDKALAELKALGDSLQTAVSAAESRDKAVTTPSF